MSSKGTLGAFGLNTITFPNLSKQASTVTASIEKQAQDDEAKKGKEKSKGKGDGINAALVLLKDLRDFQDKVESCIEAQDITEYKGKVETFNAELDKMYEVLLEIARGGMHSNRVSQDQNGQSAQSGQPSYDVSAPTLITRQ